MKPRPRSRRWVVRDDDPNTVGAALAHWGVEPEAAKQGRVFVGPLRASASTPLASGDVVEVHPPRSGHAAANVSILARRDGILAVSKPAGIPTIPDRHGTDASLIAVVASLVGVRDPAHVHTSSRLDADVSGVVLMAISPRARDQLREAREAGRYQRHYIAISASAPATLRAAIDASIGRGRDRNSRQINGPGAVPALTHYAVAATTGQYGLIAAEPVTGRTHQIRLHLAHVGAPLVGDRTYGSGKTLTMPSGAVRVIDRIALHAAWVRIELADKAEPWTVRAPIPPELRALWRELGGDDTAWHAALEPLGAGDEIAPA